MKAIILTESVKTWNEPRKTLLAVKKLLKPYLGKKVVVWGGGGYECGYLIANLDYHHITRRVNFPLG